MFSWKNRAGKFTLIIVMLLSPAVFWAGVRCQREMPAGTGETLHTPE